MSALIDQLLDEEPAEKPSAQSVPTARLPRARVATRRSSDARRGRLDALPGLPGGRGMICSSCGSDRWEYKVHKGPFGHPRLEWTICRQCGSAQAHGITNDGRSITLIRDTFVGEERVTLGGRTQRRPMRGGTAV